MVTPSGILDRVTLDIGIAMVEAFLSMVLVTLGTK